MLRFGVVDCTLAVCRASCHTCFDTPPTTCSVPLLHVVACLYTYQFPLIIEDLSAIFKNSLSLPAHHPVLNDIARQGASLPVRLLVSLDERHRFWVQLLAPLRPLLSLGIQVETLARFAAEQTLLDLMSKLCCAHECRASCDRGLC